MATLSQRLIFSVILGCVVGVILLVDNFAIRVGAFENKRSCYYGLARPAPRQVDVLIVGSSRILHGIDPDLLANLLDVPKLRVINLGHPGHHYDFDYVLIEQLILPWHPSLILAETNLERPARPSLMRNSKNVDYSNDFVQFASYRQIFVNVLKASDQPAVLRIYDGLNLTVAKIELALRFSLVGGLSEVLGRTPGLADRHNICWLKSFDRSKGPQLDMWRSEQQELAQEFFKSHADWFEDGYFEPTMFQDRNGRIQVTYLRRTVQLAKEHGVRIAFINLPRYFTWPPSPAFVDEFETRIGAPVLVPDKQVLYGFQQQGAYRDWSHLSASGRAAFTVWLAQRLLAQGLWTRQ